MNKFIKVTDSKGHIWVSVDRILYIEPGITGSKIKVGEKLIAISESVKTVLALIENPSEVWDEDRIDIIGQNGNDGLHYD